jgi:hypothetical protein
MMTIAATVVQRGRSALLFHLRRILRGSWYDTNQIPAANGSVSPSGDACSDLSWSLPLKICAIQFGDDPGALVRGLQVSFAKATLIGDDPDFEQFVAKVVGLSRRRRRRT